MTSLSKQRTASAIAASQLRVELSSFRVHAEETKAHVFSTTTESEPPTATSRGDSNGHSAEISGQSSPSSDLTNSGLGAPPKGAAARPRAEDVQDDPVASSGVAVDQVNDAGAAGQQATQGSITRQPGESWSDFYARRAAAA